ncbi:trimeric intracellular cation channel family protein [Pseudoxanthomonas gei]|uniref:Trimeric intracellular cation channel family protein n=1 Tax=Pseudoxanthomonas gei TaxID=1383030 RepID=A0ABX0AEK6_9GAMM|nr:trimeric intracellular cation channel family protein [Pseudoxanthomonas gei]
MLLHVLFLIAIAAEAMSAALVAGRREMDWLGVCVLACVTALGGGTLRDVLLGRHPLSWIEHPYYLVIVLVAALATALIAPIAKRLRTSFLVLDAIGLVVFTVIGCDIAQGLGLHWIVILVSGMVTGTFGGVLRDVLCTQIPLLFRKELYASVSLVTGALYMAAPHLGIQHGVGLVVAMVVGFVLRMLAIRYHWEMPKFVYRDDWD